MKHNWEYKKLGEVASYINGYAFKPEQWTDSGTPIIRIQNLNSPDAPFNHYDGEVPEKVKVKNGDLLISWSASLGAYIWNGNDAFLNQHIFKVVFDKCDIDKFYLKYAVSSKLDAMCNLVHGATMKHIVKTDFDNTIIPLPPLPIQQKIVAELDKVCLIIEKKKQQLKELDKLAQAIFYDMFGDPVENEKGWEVNSLNRIALLKNGLNFGKVDEGVKVKILGVSDFQENKKISSKEIGYTIVSKEVEDNFYLKDNDLVFVRSNGSKSLIGRCVLINTFGEKVSYSGFCIRCRIVSDKVIPQFLLSLMQEPKVKVQLICGGRGCNIQNINQENLGKQPIILPPLSLQQSFAAKIEAIEKQKELISRSIKEAQTLFDERMDYWFD